MEPIDVAITGSLMKTKSRFFNQILGDVGVAPNTLRLHLDRLINQGIVSREKLPVNGRGRPKFTYSMLTGANTPSTPGLNPSTGVVSLGFTRLSQVCRFEKGGFCKKVRGSCNARICPQIR